MSRWLPFCPAGRRDQRGQARRAVPVPGRSCGLITLGIFACLIVFSVKLPAAARQRGRPPDQPARGSWRPPGRCIPLGLAMIPFFWGATLYFDLPEPADDALDVTSSRGSGCGRSSTRTARPRSTSCTSRSGSRSELTMISQDVIHSFFVPAFRVKMDVLPGPLHHRLVHARRRPGEYRLECAEYCGTDHSADGRLDRRHGAGRIRDLARHARARSRWRSQGERLFQQLGCNGCHRADSLARAPRRWTASTASPVRLQDGRPGARRRRPTSAVDPEPERPGGRRLAADHADLPGAAHRGAAAGS